MKGKAIPHDPFHDPAPQISNVYEYEEPEELTPFDEATRGGVNSTVEITDPNHRAKFVPTKEEEHDFSPKRGRGK
jgi:hypothetical protein